jgi:GntR family transcriptional repressor for pyruvate dehydrogenase complex
MLPAGARLPSEEELAQRFGTSRATVREALRLLAAWNLVTSVVGRRGGTFVTSPDVESITELIRSNIVLLADSRPLSLDELLEVREMLEVPAAGFAAERWDDESLARIRDCLIPDLSRTSAEQQARTDVRFHRAVLDAAGNPMLIVAAQPILSVLNDNLTKIPQPPEFREGVQHCHAEIFAAIEARDAERARDQTRKHLDELRPYYHRATRAGGRSTAGSV